MPEPFDDLLQALRAAADLYRADAVTSRIAAVSATISFLRASNVEPSLYTPLFDVLAHLEDEQQDRTGNTMPSMEAANLGAAAAVITLARGAGYTLEDAARMVARKVGLGRPSGAGTKTSPWEQLLKFRKNMMERRKPEAAMRAYTAVIQEANKSGLSPGHALQLGLQFLSEKVKARTKA